MFHCEDRFQEYTKIIRRVWEGRFNIFIGNWGNPVWWWAVAVVWGWLLIVPLIAIRGTVRQGMYCIEIKDCIPFPFIRQGWPLPAWYWFHIVLAIAFFFSSLMTQWAYRHGRWCLAWWAYLIYVFAVHFFMATLPEWGLFMGFSGSPIPTALVGYGVPIIYTVWFFSAVLPPMRRLWRGERLDLGLPHRKLDVGAGSSVALLGLLGVMLGRMFGQMPHGRWGDFAVGLIGTPWLMYMSVHYSVQSLLTLAPWRIVQAAEAAKKVLEEAA